MSKKGEKINNGRTINHKSFIFNDSIPIKKRPIAGPK